MWHLLFCNSEIWKLFLLLMDEVVQTIPLMLKFDLHFFRLWECDFSYLVDRILEQSWYFCCHGNAVTFSYCHGNAVVTFAYCHGNFVTFPWMLYTRTLYKVYRSLLPSSELQLHYQMLILFAEGLKKKLLCLIGEAMVVFQVQ